MTELQHEPDRKKDHAEEMYDALRIAYGLTCNMPTTNTQDDSDLACARRHMLTSLRSAGFGA